MHVKKILVANRGEIPIRIFRTAHELSLHTVAVFSYEDRLSMHRQKADEAYVIGKRGQYTPVGAYLAGDEIVKIAVEHGVQMIHPGYGFLSENAEFARKVEKAGLIFVGPSPRSLTRSVTRSLPESSPTLPTSLLFPVLRAPLRGTRRSRTSLTSMDFPSSSRPLSVVVAVVCE
ncbi:hypothetical protein NXS19_012137 [Fusarium pseudograminearum]|nr:hypothetical protein NXS19_012137 [Fusarium pseudograminearum]